MSKLHQQNDVLGNTKNNPEIMKKFFAGCGCGKYLDVNPSIFNIGSDRCNALTQIARQRDHEVRTDSNLENICTTFFPTFLHFRKALFWTVRNSNYFYFLNDLIFDEILCLEATFSPSKFLLGIRQIETKHNFITKFTNFLKTQFDVENENLDQLINKG